MRTITDVLNKGLEITWGEIRIAKNIIHSRGADDVVAKRQCQKALDYISFLHELGLISFREAESMVEYVRNEKSKPIE